MNACKTRSNLGNPPPTQIVSQYFLVLQSLYTERFYTDKLLHRGAFTHRYFYFYTKKHYTQKFYTQKLLHTEAFTHRRFYTQMSLHRKAACSFYKRNFYTEQVFTQTSFYTDKFLHRSLLLQQAFTQRSFYTEQAFTYATATEIPAPKPDLGTKAKKGRF